MKKENHLVVMLSHKHDSRKRFFIKTIYQEGCYDGPPMIWCDVVHYPKKYRGYKINGWKDVYTLLKKEQIILDKGLETKLRSKIIGHW